MAEPLKNRYGPEIPRQIAAMIAGVDPGFDAEGFVRESLTGYDVLELMDRGRHMARVLQRFLPADFEAAAEVLIASLGPKIEAIEGSGMAPFLYLPHTNFVAFYGLDHLETSLRAQYELTQRFTAEFSIRPFLERYPEAVLKRLELWSEDGSHHVRRLVSEGTRPRLPWGSRLKAFQKDPSPVLGLLERLKDDASLYVRRSVANNLNDIGKDNPDRLIATAQNWMQNATPERAWIVRHALRSAVKRGDVRALAVLGFENGAEAQAEAVKITPAAPKMGESVSVAFTVVNTAETAQRLLVDLRVGFVKANGKTAPKVFKLKTLTLEPGQKAALSKTLSLAEITTRKHYPGRHTIEALINAQAVPLGAFTLLPA